MDERIKRSNIPRTTGTLSNRTVTGNRLLSVLPNPVRRAVERMEVQMGPHLFLQSRNTPLEYAYFPSSGLISLVLPAGSRFTEVAMVGQEGMFGLPLFHGVNTSPMSALVQVSGRAVKIDPQQLKEHIRRNPAFAEVLGRYAHAFTTMLAQSAVCCHVHKIEQRFARWLLMAQDRLHTDEFRLTQQSLANILGVRRPSVSEAAATLQKRRLISYRLGSLTILNRRGLEQASCECYRIIRREFDTSF